MESPDSITCTRCGSPASGRFCNNCGAPLTAAPCRHCGAQLSPGGRFCHLCGAPLGRVPSAGGRWSQTAGWIVAAVASVGLFVVVALQLTGGGGGRPPAAAAGGPALGGRPAPDISNLSPRERADRLFDRVMRLNEAGRGDSVAFFLPMARQAYALIGPLDADARYHLGLMDALAGDTAALSAQLDSLRREEPGHLFGTMLAYTKASLEGDTAGVRAAYQEFLDRVDTERATSREEYSMHTRVLDAFQADAQAALGRGPGSTASRP